MSAPTETPEAAAAAARRQRIVGVINAATFAAVCQHAITVQTEPALVTKLCGGDTARAVRLLAASQTAGAGIGLFVNQAGGKVSDSIGRRQLLLLGPLFNFLLGQLVFRNPTSLRAVLICRLLRMLLTTFSSSVIGTAALTDICAGRELAAASAKLGATVGLAVIATPFMENVILQRTNKDLKYPYLALSMFGLAHAVLNFTMMPETLEKEKRKSMADAMSVQSLNPFGFVKIYTKGSSALKKMATITTLQTFLEGGNLSDIIIVWMRDHIKLDNTRVSMSLMLAGVAYFLGGSMATPRLVRTQTARRFTTITNSLNMAGMFLQGLAPLTSLFAVSILLRMAGANGAAATTLRAASSDRATAEGIGKGEFSAWSNNLRGVTKAAAPMVFGGWYAFAQKRGIPAGTVWWVAGVMGALLPELMMQFVTDAELSGEKADADGKTGARKSAAQMP